MKKKIIGFFSVLLIITAIVISYFFDTGDTTPYTVNSTGEHGASLIYDTLRHMGYNARRNFQPLTAKASINDVYIIIHPRMPQINFDMAEEIREWVSLGGRLIYFCENDIHFMPYGREVGGFRINQILEGEIFSGQSAKITNRALMEDYTTGEAVQTTISRWNSVRPVENIFFAEYYHGFQTSESFLGRLPLIMRLIFAQIIILSFVIIWHMGKRFGNAVPYYEEVEREENEYVRALAKLYAGRKEKK